MISIGILYCFPYLAFPNLRNVSSLLFFDTADDLNDETLSPTELLCDILDLNPSASTYKLYDLQLVTYFLLLAPFNKREN